MVKKYYWICFIILPVYAFFNALQRKPVIQNDLTGAPGWLNYIGLAIECILIIALLVAFALLAKRIPNASLPAWAKVLRWAGLAVIAALGLWLGINRLAGMQDAKWISVLCSVFRTLLYAGVWLLITECVKLIARNK